MDQLRKALAWLKEQHFWVLSGLVVLIGFACWWSAAGTLSALYEANQAQIKQGFAGLENLQREPFHPNEAINQKQEEETQRQAKNVAAIWQQLYERQRETVLKWPSGPGQLSERFVEHVEKLEFGDENIPRNLRGVYQNYILNHYPKLPQKIGARPVREGETGGFGGGRFSREMMGPEGPGAVPLADEPDYLVEWDPQDQAAIRAELEFRQQPSPLRIWVTQENLWVYHTLLNVIKNTNDAANATRNSNAAVRIVYSLQVGQRAAPYSRTPGRIYQVPLPRTSTGELGAPESEFGPASPEGGPAPVGRPMEFGGPRMGETDMSSLSPEEEQAALLTFRYLDAEGKPMGGDGMSASPDDPAATVGTPVDLETLRSDAYKRLPVRMVMQMDLRHLPQLIGECAQQALQVEVQEVRINPEGLEVGGSGFGGSMGGGARFGDSLGGGTGLYERSGIQYFDPQPHIATVVVQGVIYIFNKPNPKLLETAPGDEAQVATY